MSEPSAVSLVLKGTPDHPRWMLANQYEHYWNEDKQKFVKEEHATVYASTTEAAYAVREIQKDHFQGRKSYFFVAPLVIEIISDEQPTLYDVAMWLAKNCRVLISTPPCSEGPVKEMDAMMLAEWRALKSVPEGAKTCQIVAPIVPKSP